MSSAAPVDHAERSHARYSASGAYRWFRCPGSVALLEKHPPLPTSPSAAEGTRAHEILESRIRAWLEGLPWEAPAGLPADMLPAVNSAFEFIQDLVLLEPDGEIWSETHFAFPQSVVAKEHAGGTADAIIWWPTKRTIHVVDYKHGVMPVEADTPQLAYYGAGARAYLQETEPGCEIDKVFTWIVQPRAFHSDGFVRSEVMTPQDLDMFISKVEGHIKQCEAPDAPLKAGSVQCRFCDVRAVCPAAQAEAFSVVTQDFKGVQALPTVTLPNPDQLHADTLATILRSRSMVDSFFDAVEERARMLMMSGGTVPGWKLVEQAARRVWKDDEIVTAAKLISLSGGKLTEDDVRPRKLLALTNAEALLKETAREHAPRGKKKEAAQKIAEAMAYLTDKNFSTGKYLMVEETDPRPAVSAVQQAYGTVALPQIDSVKSTGE